MTNKINKKKLSEPCIWDIGLLPYYFAPHKEPSNGDLPDALPFCLQADSLHGFVTQRYSSKVESALREAYLRGSDIGEMSDESITGGGYVSDFLEYMKSVLNKNSFDGLRVLEIGCGSGSLLYQLKQLNADVLGLEPGVHAKSGAEKYGLRIERDFFPSQKVTGKFDIIVAVSVLEHIVNLDAFFQNVMNHLEENGVFLISVPDCEPFFLNGDVSILLHEHWNYFTVKGLSSVVTGLLDGIDISITRAGYGGALYAVIRKSSSPVSNYGSEFIDLKRPFEQFIEKTEESLEKLATYLGNTEKTIGIFAPHRAINALYLIRERIDFSKIRFFDDSENLQGTYFPGFDITIEGRDMLFRNPPDRVIIFSRAFSSKIENELKRNGLTSKIITWDNLFLEDTSIVNE